VSLIKTNRTASGAAAIGARAKDRAKDAAAQAVPVGKTAVQGVRQGVQGAKEWAAPRLEDAVQGAQEAVIGAREWAAPLLEDAADAVTASVAPKVSSALRSTARQVKPDPKAGKTGIRRLLSLRWLLGAGALFAAAGATAAIAMRRRYASATAAANDATESPEGDQVAETGEAAPRSEVNGRVTTPGS
jgi:hypothetical protein